MENKEHNQSEQNLTSEVTAGNTHGSAKSIAFVIVIFLLAIIAGYVLFVKKDRPKTSEQVISRQSAEFRKRVADLPADAPKEERYSYYLRIARGFYLVGQYDQAIEWLDKFAEEDRNYPGVWYHYALIAKATGQKEKALTDVRKAVTATPDNPQIWELYFELVKDQSKEAQDAIYREALIATENDPTIVETYNAFKASQ
jgi:tetratricopeptide (TPR) repeat protein